MAATNPSDLAGWVAAGATIIGILIPLVLEWRRRKAKAQNQKMSDMIHAEIGEGPGGTPQVVVDNWKQLTDALARERGQLSDELDRRSASFQAQIEALQDSLRGASLRIAQLEDDNAKLHEENAELYRRLSDADDVGVHPPSD